MQWEKCFKDPSRHRNKMGVVEGRQETWGERERAEEMYRLKCLAVGFKVQEMDNVTTCMDQYIGCNVCYIVSPASLQHNTFHHYSCQHHHHHSSFLTGCKILTPEQCS
jgi:hypothetical protein